MKKYELVLDDKQNYAGVTLYRIRALKDFTCIDGFTVHKGDLGGWIQTEDNLSQDGLSWICGEGIACDCGLVRDNGMVCGNGVARGCSLVRDNGVVYGTVHGQGFVCGNAIIEDNGDISKPNHVLTVGLIGSRNDTTTFYRDIDHKISVVCGCFSGKIDDFLQQVIEVHGDSKHGQAYLKAIELAKIQIDLS